MAKRRKDNKNNELQIDWRTNGHANLQVDRLANTNKPTPLTALFVTGIGLYPIAIGLKILPISAHSLHVPYWVITAVGITLFFSGLAIGLQCLGQAKSHLYKIVVAIILLAILTPFAWLVFGDSHLSMFFRIAFASPFAIILLLLLPGGKSKIIANPNGKPMSELLKERRNENSGRLQKRKLNKESNETNES
ncbi:MAG: hypothetical protein Q8T09_01480 [Candidatus Melainabacteria bacterium]|nr:hypothetical protein [Candidatus Melainabacteria bacterium]